MFQEKVEFLPLLSMLLPTTLSALSYRLWFSRSVQGAPGNKGASRHQLSRDTRRPHIWTPTSISECPAVSLIICRDNEPKHTLVSRGK